VNWLPLARAHAALMERGLTDREAANELTVKIATFALTIKPERLFDRSYGPGWLQNPAIDFQAGTIAMPLKPVPGSWQVLERPLTAVRVDVNGDQLDELWPAQAAPEAHTRFSRDDELALEGKAGLQSRPPRWSNMHQAAIELAARADGPATIESKVRRIEGKISRALETSRNISKD
jgi:hypothetical protein